MRPDDYCPSDWAPFDPRLEDEATQNTLADIRREIAEREEWLSVWRERQREHDAAVARFKEVFGFEEE